MTSEIFNIDCVEYMRTLPDEHFDLAVVDPPYGINAGNMQMGISTTRKYSRGKNWDLGVPGPEYFDELFRVSREQIIWGGNYFPLPLSEDWIVWDKMNYGRSFSEAEFAWCSIHRKIRVFRFRTTTPVEGGKIHPTQKPVELYTWLLSNYARGGQRYSILTSGPGPQESPRINSEWISSVANWTRSISAPRTNGSTAFVAGLRLTPPGTQRNNSIYLKYD